MRIRALLLSTLFLTLPAQAQPTGVWGERGLATMPDARVGQDREFELGTRLISLGGLPTALAGYGRFSFMQTDATLMYGIPGLTWPVLSLKHQLQRPTRENPTGVAVGLGMLGAPARPGLPGSNLYVTLTRDINTRQNGQDWTLFSAHLGFQADLSLQSRLMAGLELPLGQHGSATAEWIGAQGGESGYANFGLHLSPLPALSLSLFSLGLPNASLFDRGLAIGAGFNGVLPNWFAKTASAPQPAPTPKPVSTPKPAAEPSVAKVPSVKALPVAPSAPPSPPPPPKLPVAEAPAKVPALPVPLPSVPSTPPASVPKPPAMPTGTLIGRALDGAGKAIADASVTLGAPGTAARTAKTTPSGYFTFGGLANGTYTVTLADPEGRPISSQSVTLSGSTLEITLKPQAVARLKGQIVDAQTGSALSGATVTIGKERDASDRDGYFTFNGLPAAPWSVAVSAKGYAPSTLTITDGNPRIALTPLPGTVSGRVLTTSGKPVAGAIAQIGALRAPSDANGNYLLSNVPAGSHTLTLLQDGKTLLSSAIQVPPGGKAVKDAKVRDAAPVGRFGMIGGDVRNAAGEALKGVKIVVEGKAVTVLTVTDEAGRFSVLELLPGEYRLKLEKGSYLDQEAKAQVKAGSLASVSVTMRSR